MRWERLFDDLEARLAATDRAELAAEVDERAVAERAGVELASRIAAHRGRELALVVRGGSRVAGVVRAVAADAVLLDSAGVETLVPSHAIVSADRLERRVGQRTSVEVRLRAATFLRGLAEQGGRVLVETTGGRYAGTLTEVGADHLDLAEEGVTRTVAFAAILLVRPAPDRQF